MRMRTQ